MNKYSFFPFGIIAAIITILLFFALLESVSIPVSLFVSAAIWIGIMIAYKGVEYPARSKKCYLCLFGGMIVILSSFYFLRPSYMNHSTPVVLRDVKPLAMGINNNELWLVIPDSNGVRLITEPIHPVQNASNIFVIQEILHTNRFGKCPTTKFELKYQ